MATQIHFEPDQTIAHPDPQELHRWTVRTALRYRQLAEDDGLTQDRRDHYGLVAGAVERFLAKGKKSQGGHDARKK